MSTLTEKGESIVFATTLYVVYFFVSIYRALGVLYHQTYYTLSRMLQYHHLTPQRIRADVSKLAKIPRHIAFILTLKGIHVEGGGIEGIFSDIGEITAWCVGAGSPEITIYEKTGCLKKLPIQDVYNAVRQRLSLYFSSDGMPSFKIVIPETGIFAGPGDAQFTVYILSEKDGRTLIVELTRVFAELALQNRLKPEDLTLDFIDQKLKSRSGPEPDLIIMFSSHIDLQGIPPWHIRLSEMIALPDNHDVVSYHVFIRALRKYSSVKIKLGR